MSCNCIGNSFLNCLTKSVELTESPIFSFAVGVSVSLGMTIPNIIDKISMQKIEHNCCKAVITQICSTQLEPWKDFFNTTNIDYVCRKAISKHSMLADLGIAYWTVVAGAIALTGAVVLYTKKKTNQRPQMPSLQPYSVEVNEASHLLHIPTLDYGIKTEEKGQ